jgi:hypothetical protein
MGSVNEKAVVETVARIKQSGLDRSPTFWDRLTPSSLQDVRRCESEIRRKLPPVFSCFLTTLGWGDFGGELNHQFIYSPSEISEARGLPIRTLFGADLISDEQLNAAYSLRDVALLNPMILLEGVNLLDVVQFGQQSSGGYHLLGVDGTTIGYVLMLGGSFAGRAPTFEQWIGRTIETAELG